jgi:hypothetical protein
LPPQDLGSTFILMGHPLKLSDELMRAARLVAKDSKRSVAAQIDYWVRLGQGLDEAIRPRAALKAKRRPVPLKVPQRRSSR